MTDFTTGRNKDLDLVISVPRAEPYSAPKRFSDLVDEYGILLTSDEANELRVLPELTHGPVGDVLVALEAKACMTAQSRARPRLFDELTSSAQCILGAAQQAIAVGHVLVNASPRFVSPKNNKFPLASRTPVVNEEAQPRQAQLTQDKVRQLRVRSHLSEMGFDAVGVTTLYGANDLSPFELATVPPGLASTDPYNYERMILRIAGIYNGRFASL